MSAQEFYDNNYNDIISFISAHYSHLNLYEIVYTLLYEYVDETDLHAIHTALEEG